MSESAAAVRRRTMQAVKSKDTTPERLVRQVATKLGYRYRIHRNELPGKPDLAFIGQRKVVFVHGCFWHGHACARGNRVPKQNRAYWVAKIARNKARDLVCQRALKAAGWRMLVLWECELKDRKRLAARIQRFLTGAKPPKL